VKLGPSWGGRNQRALPECALGKEYIISDQCGGNLAQTVSSMVPPGDKNQEGKTERRRGCRGGGEKSESYVRKRPAGAEKGS